MGRATIVGITGSIPFLMIFAAFFVAAAFGFWGIPKLFPPSYEKTSAVVSSPEATKAPKSHALKPELKASVPDPPLIDKPTAPIIKTATPAPALPAKDAASTPEILRKIDPERTDSAKRANVTGSVRLAFFINPNGFPSTIRVVRGMGYGLNRKAIEALSHWRFRPVTKDGKPVEVQVEVPFR